MVDNIKAVGSESISPVSSPITTPKTDKSDKSFKDILLDSINKVNELQLESEKVQEELALGKTENIEASLLAIRKAKTTFNLLMQIRNKLVEAYEEIQRMRI
jgi:flagellar hook-basal body complex protein FliE